MSENKKENHESKLAYEPPEDERPATASPTEQDLETQVPTVAKLDYSPAPPHHDPYAAFRFVSFRLFIVSFMLATLGSQVMSVAVQWELAQRTNSPLMLGFLGGLQALPVILLALPAGHVSDIVSRKRVLMVTQVVLVICPIVLAVLAFFARGWEHYVVTMFGIILANAVALAFARPARQAYLPQLVPGDIFSNAVTWNSTTFELASITGPAIGGAIIYLARSGVEAALLISGVCLGICFILTAFLPGFGPASRGERASFKNLLAGIRFVFSQKVLLATMTLDLFAVLFGGATYLLPFFAKNLLHVGSLGFGLLRAAPSIGAVTMALLIAHLPPMKRAGRAMLLAVIGFGLATIGFGLSRWFWFSMLMLFLTGAFDNISVVVRHTLVQLFTPDSMRGRVSAVNLVFIGASNELGGFESGLTAAMMGLVGSVVFGGIGTLVVVGIVALVWPQVVRLGALRDIKPTAPPEADKTHGFPVVTAADAPQPSEPS
jgi:MFS family permease